MFRRLWKWIRVGDARHFGAVWILPDGISAAAVAAHTHTHIYFFRLFKEEINELLFFFCRWILQKRIPKSENNVLLIQLFSVQIRFFKCYDCCKQKHFNFHWQFEFWWQRSECNSKWWINCLEHGRTSKLIYMKEMGTLEKECVQNDEIISDIWIILFYLFSCWFFFILRFETIVALHKNIFLFSILCFLVLFHNHE